MVLGDSDRTRGNTHKVEGPSEHQETLFYCEGDHTAQAQVAQRGHGVSSLAVFESHLGRVLGRVHWVPLLRQELGWRAS